MSEAVIVPPPTPETVHRILAARTADVDRRVLIVELDRRDCPVALRIERLGDHLAHRHARDPYVGLRSQLLGVGE